MKLKRLRINGYKNLRKTTFNFKNCINYVVLIGLNGSGKSNVLEAVSKITHSYYYKQPIRDFTFCFEYKKEDNHIKLENNKVYVNDKERKKNITDFLPEQVVASYSGEETRLWEDIFRQPYLKYFNKIKLNYINQKLRFLYINKFSWSNALLTLLCHNEGNRFVKKLLGIENLQEDIKIQFQFSEKYEDRKSKFSIANTSELTIPQLTDRIKKEQKDQADQYLKISQIATIDLGNILNEHKNLEWCKMFFEYLFLATMPKDKKLIESIKIEFNNKDIRKLSEGEKKLILIYTITHLLADDKTLVLLDEPDAHIHIERKEEIIKIIDKADCFTLFTTHSPTILNCIDEKNIRLVKNSDDSGVKVIELDKIKTLRKITNGQISIIDRTLVLTTLKDILLVEGTNDYNYIKKAIEKLSPDYDNYDFHIINCGGADNVPAVVKQSLLSILNNSQLCLCVFDNDDQGKRNYKKIEEISKEKKKSNLKAISHTEIDKKNLYIEDYFPVDCYKDLMLKAICKKQSFTELQQHQTAKSIIEKEYEKFEKSKFENFRVILNKMIEIKNDFHSLPVPK